MEFYGDGLANISLADRATIANMAPEYGATMGFFPVDEESLNYLKLTGRSDDLIDLVEAYYKEQGMFRENGMEEPIFTDTIELDLGTVEPCLAGPKRPQDRITLKEMKDSWNELAVKPLNEGGLGLSSEEVKKEIDVTYANGDKDKLKTGAVAIAAITSCTNTSNPSVMLAAGLVAKKL